MTRYRRRPVAVEAMQWLPDDPQARAEMAAWLQTHNVSFRIEDVEGDVCVSFPLAGRAALPDRWLALERDGWVSVHTADEFAAGFEPVREEAP